MRLHRRAAVRFAIRAVGRTSIVHVLVPDADAHHARAKDAGAEITEELRDLPFAHRSYSCRDPQGHEWTFAQVLTRPPEGA